MYPARLKVLDWCICTIVVNRTKTKLKRKEKKKKIVFFLNRNLISRI